MTNNQINHNLIEIIQLFLTIFDLESLPPMVCWVEGHFDIFDILLKPPQPFTGLFLICGDSPTYGWVDGWVIVWSVGGVMSNN